MSGQLWAINSRGGYMYSDNLSTELRTQLQPTLKFRQFCDAKDAVMQGLGKGDTFHWNVYSDVATQGTTLDEVDTMPETNFTITQGTLTIEQMGNSVRELAASIFSSFINALHTVIIGRKVAFLTQCN